MSTWTQTTFTRLIFAAVVTAASGPAQQAGPPELTLNEAIQQAIANNSSLKTASLETLRAADDLAANRTKRFANTQIIGLGGQLLTKPSFTFQQGALGTYAATGPVPATNQTVNIARKPAGTVFASIAQPLSQQYRIHLQLKALSLGLQATRQEQEKTRFGGRRPSSACLLLRCSGPECG
jgi:outer membrane protein